MEERKNIEAGTLTSRGRKRRCDLFGKAVKGQPVFFVGSSSAGL